MQCGDGEAETPFGSGKFKNFSPKFLVWTWIHVLEEPGWAEVSCAHSGYNSLLCVGTKTHLASGSKN